MKQTTKKELVAVKIDPRLVSELDSLAQRQFRSRSDVIRQALLRELQANGLCPAA